MNESGFLKTDILRLWEQFSKKSDQNEEYLDYVKDQEESNIEGIPIK